MKSVRMAARLPAALLLFASNALHSTALAQEACATGVACPGFALSTGYTADLRRNNTGGLERGDVASGLLKLDATWTTDRLLPAALVISKASMIHTTGGAISGRYVGDLQGLNNIEAPAALRLYELWSEVAFGGTVLSTRMGLLDLNTEFDAPLTSSFFLGPPFGIGTDLAQTGQNGPAVFPVTSLGLRLAGRISRGLRWRLAAFDGVPGRTDRNSFATVKVSRRQGALLIGELESAPTGFNKVAVGGWSYTAAFDMVDAQANTTASLRKGNRGAYAMVDLPIASIGATRLDGVLRAGGADARFNAISRYVGAAMVVSHLSDARPDDAVGLAIAHGRTGAAFRRQLAFDGGEPYRAETQLELTWRMAATPWLAIVPTTQWINHPGADRAMRDAWVVGLRFEMNFNHSWPLLARDSGQLPAAPLVVANP